MQIGELVHVAMGAVLGLVRPEPLPKFHVHLDADRDGTVDDDWKGLGGWRWGRGKRGATFLCNDDDDDRAGSQDNTNDVINGGNDDTEIAPIEIRKHGTAAVPGSWTGILEVVRAADARRVRIFDSNAAGGTEIIGPTAGQSHTLPDLAFDTKEFGVEAVFFAGEDADSAARRPAWDGHLYIKFRIEDGGSVIYTQTVRMRVAPWMMMHHLDDPLQVFVVDDGPDGVDAASGKRFGNGQFRTDLAAAVGGVPLVEHPSADVWMQDCMEIGFTSLPNRDFPIATRARRGRDLTTFPSTLLDEDFGYRQVWPPPGAGARISTLDSNGNLEVSPPCKSSGRKDYPLGRIYFGGQSRGPRARPTTFDPDVRRFLERQAVQAPFSINTAWLSVAHVDEVVSFVKAPGGQGFKMLIASWRRARTILRAQRLADPSVKMLVGREMERWDPLTDTFVGYDNVEVTVGDFLSTGIPSLGSRGSRLHTFNTRVQARLDVITAKFKSMCGVKNADIIEIPIVYFPSDGDPSLADALTGGMVNALVLGTTCIMAKAFGPEPVPGGDLFEAYVTAQLAAIGVTPTFVDDWYPYHIQLGEVHCGTNTLRDPGFKEWWEFVP